MCLSGIWLMHLHWESHSQALSLAPDCFFSKPTPQSKGWRNCSYPGARPAKESEGIAINRWRHQVHPHRPPAPAVPLVDVQTPFHSAALQSQDQEALCKVVHGLELDRRELWHVKSGRLVIRVQQNALEEQEKGVDFTREQVMDLCWAADVNVQKMFLLGVC